PGGDAGSVEAASDAVLQDLLDNGITAAELAQAKNALIADTVYSRDNQSRLARIMGTALVIGETVDQVKRYPKAMALVTADDVLAIARKVVDIRRSVTGTLLPAPGAQAEAPPAPAIPSTTIQ